MRVAPADFRPGIVPAHSGPARGSDDLISPQMLGELLGGVLAPPVRVEDRLSSCVRAPAGRHIDRLAYQIGAHVVRHRVPDCFLRAAAGDGRQVHEPLPGADIGDIAHPLHSRPVGGEVPPDQVGARAQVRGRDGGADLSAWLCGLQALGAHDGAHRVRARLNASAGQGGVDPSVPVGAAGAVEDPLDQGAELLSASHGS